MVRPNDLVISLREIEPDDVDMVGVQAAKLGDLASLNFPVLPGFVVTGASYRDFIKQNNLERKIESLLSTINYDNHDSLFQVSRHIKNLINTSTIPDQITKRIYDEYLDLRSQDVVINSGNKKTEIGGDANLLVAIRDAWASFFDIPNLIKLQGKNVLHLAEPIFIHKSLNGGISGVIYTIDHENIDKNKVIIKIGENISVLDKNEQKVLENGGQNILHDAELSLLAKLGLKVEKQYYFPQEISWLSDGVNIYITQVKSLTPKHPDEAKIARRAHQAILVGEPANTGISVGNIKKIEKSDQVNDIKTSDVVVIASVTPTIIPALKQASAVIVESNHKNLKSVLKSSTGMPAIIGAANALSVLKNGEGVTVNGKTGKVFSGGFLSKNPGLNDNFLTPATRTDVLVNIDNAAGAENNASAEGVGVLSGEKIFEAGGTHPKKILEDKNKRHLVSEIAANIEKVAKLYYPRPVIYQFSDLTTQQYSKLRGGKIYETAEDNPLLGFRGATRMVRDSKIFKSELEAIKEVRNKKGLKNVEVMVPFARTVTEFADVKKMINVEGLKRSNTFKLHLMVQLPSNVIMLQKFIDEGLDGITVSLDDLVMHIYGIDHANIEVSGGININDPAISWAIENIVHVAHKNGVPVTVYSSSSSFYQSFVSKLIEAGIDALTVNTQEVEDARRMIYFAERSIINMN